MAEVKDELKTELEKVERSFSSTLEPRKPPENEIPIQDIHKSPTPELLSATEISVMPAPPVGLQKPTRTEKFLNIGKKGVSITREHVHSPVKITIKWCPDCGKVIGGGEKKR